MGFSCDRRALPQLEKEKCLSSPAHSSVALVSTLSPKYKYFSFFPLKSRSPQRGMPNILSRTPDGGSTLTSPRLLTPRVEYASAMGIQSGVPALSIGKTSQARSLVRPATAPLHVGDRRNLGCLLPAARFFLRQIHDPCSISAGRNMIWTHHNLYPSNGVTDVTSYWYRLVSKVSDKLLVS